MKMVFNKFYKTKLISSLPATSPRDGRIYTDSFHCVLTVGINLNSNFKGGTNTGAGQPILN